MPRPLKVSYTPAAPDGDGLADGNDSSGASLTLDGALTSGGAYSAADGLGHRIDITDTATTDQSGATFTITGTNANGDTISEAVTGPGSGATVTSTDYFATVSSIAIANGAGSATVDVGTNDEVATPTYCLNYRSMIEIGLAVNISGTINYSVQHTLDNILQDGTANAAYLPHASLVNKTADADGNYDFGVCGTRVITNSGESGAVIPAGPTNGILLNDGSSYILLNSNDYLLLNG